ncbi:MAG: M14 family metallopeptidase [Cytophagaceae bacterium]|nr:M14 family metallopeptidase [Gemmatimonadaceae bacterium]
MNIQRLSLIAVSLLTLASCGPAAVVRSTASLPRTQAERTNYAETSTHAQVLTFLDALGQLGKPLSRGSVGRTSEGRDIPFVIASRPLFDSPESARRSGRPIVYVQGNIHAGEVEGKEALQALLRDLLVDPRPNALDSIVLIAVPIYNGDGNERFDTQAKNRGAQNGPEMVGQRPNAQGFDLNRDYIKAEAPETRASLAMFNRWDPHLFVDLHTTNGSYHGYALTYAPSLNPAGELPGATFGAAWARDSFLPELQRRITARHNVATFPYGNFAQDEGPTSVPKGWLTYDHRPRFGTNYYALRGRVSILSEAYSHDPFETRVRATYAFVKELLSLAAERGRDLQGLASRSDAALATWGRGNGPAVPLRAALTTTPVPGDVIYEVLERTTDTTRREPGVRAGLRRTGRFVTQRMPVVDRFTPTRTRPVPYGWAISASDTAITTLLALHGITTYRLRTAWSGDAGPQYDVDSTIIAPRAFQGRREVRLEVRQASRPVSLPMGTVVVPVAQPRGVLAMYLLEPESDDGVVNWDVAGRAATTPASLVVTRLARDPGLSLERIAASRP